MLRKSVGLWTLFALIIATAACGRPRHGSDDAPLPQPNSDQVAPVSSSGDAGDGSAADGDGAGTESQTSDVGDGEPGDESSEVPRDGETDPVGETDPGAPDDGRVPGDGGADDVGQRGDQTDPSECPPEYGDDCQDDLLSETCTEHDDGTSTCHQAWESGSECESRFVQSSGEPITERCCYPDYNGTICRTITFETGELCEELWQDDEMITSVCFGRDG